MEKNTLCKTENEIYASTFFKLNKGTVKQLEQRENKRMGKCILKRKK